MHLKVGIHIHIHDISDQFEGQCHRSKVKVTKVKNFSFSTYNQKMRSKVEVTRYSHQVMVRRSISGAWLLVVTRSGRCINAGAFSFKYAFHQVIEPNYTKAMTGLDWSMPTYRPYITEPLLVVYTPSQVILIQYLHMECVLPIGTLLYKIDRSANTSLVQSWPLNCVPIALQCIAVILSAWAVWQSM